MLGTGANRRLLATLAVLAFITAALPSSAWSQADPRRQALSPIARALLEQAIAGEEVNKRRSPGRSTWQVSFPFVMCAFEGGLCGAVNRDGSIAVPPKFDFVDDFHEGRAVVRQAGLYGYVDLRGHVVVEPKYALAGRYRLGLAEVDIGGKSALIDLDGKEVLAPRFVGAIPFTRTVFWVNDGERDLGRLRPGREELAGVSFRPTGNRLRAKANWGLIDINGTWIREPEFTDIAGFDAENPELMWAMASSKYGLIRPDGTWALEPVYTIRHQLSDGLAAVWQDNKVGFVDRTGRMVIPPKFGPLGTGDFREGMPAPAELGGRVGLIDRSGNWVLEPTYGSIFPYSAEGGSNPDLFRGFVARRGAIEDILDRTGKVLIGGMTPWLGTSSSRSTPGGGFSISFTMGQMRMFCDDGRIIGFFDRKPRLFERDGTALDLRQGELWWPLTCEPPYVVKVGARYVHVDRWLRPLTAEKFDAVGSFRYGLAPVLLRGKHGLIRDDGTWAIEPRFDAVSPIGRDRAIATLDGRSGIFDVARDQWVTQTPFDAICGGLPYFINVLPFIGVVLDGKHGVIDANGRWVIQAKYESAIGGPRLGLIPFRAGDKWGFIDPLGNETIAPRFEAVSLFDRGISWTQTSNEWCAIDRRGRPIASIACQTARPTNVNVAGGSTDVQREKFQQPTCRIPPLAMPGVPEDPPLIRPPVPR